ncbi:unnamed protein product [Polarella glacialis]|uniref:Mitochondrial carrier protein n=1 Tax=Polarella glacialis TaxID=89957 RepID=A0A813DKJ5_POLGL|nr:unnamed protein product [Polarella glacialis]CAE8720394.1 unnamed protein product [Polarella glacialis]
MSAPSSKRFSEPVINILSGGSAGLFETTLSYPLDLAKTQQQLASKPQGTSIVLRQIVRSSGFPGLYAGLSAPLVAEVPRRALKFGANGIYLGWAEDSGIFDDQQPSGRVKRAFAAGGFTGATETLLHTPFERVKTLVVQSAHHGKQLRPLECARALIQSGGLPSLYRGWEAYAFRQFVWNATFFGCIALGRETIADQSAATNFTIGLLSGSLATCLNNPLDVAKTWIQAQPSDVKPRNSIIVMKQIIEAEGLQGLSKGLAARLYRSAPGHGLLFMSFEFVSSRLRAG